VTVAVGRDPAALAAGISRWLGARRGVDGVAVTRCEAAAGGLSSDTLMVDAAAAAGWSEALVVRLAPVEGIFPVYDLAVQARAQEVAAAHGVPAAVPAEYEPDPEWLGAPFLVMPAVAGYVPGPAPLHDPWITESVDAARGVSEAMVDLLVAIHGIDWRAERLDTAIPARDLDGELVYWSAYLDWYADGEDPVPALTRALEWCCAHRPASDPPPSLLWGDVRLGNIVFGADRRPAAVLDWEMTTVGAAEHDLAWYLTLAATQDELFQAAVPGLLDHDEVCTRWEARTGRALQSLEWFEVFATVRSIAIMTRVGLLAERRGERPMLPLADNPLLDQLGRRIAAAEGSS
jgi:aminoglycoside phosphotransferase (APT) family kinase protein